MSDYLHHHRLPYVDALVFTDLGGRPRLVKLSGRVRTNHGRKDAEIKSRDFINDPQVEIANHIDVDPHLATNRLEPAIGRSPPSPVPAPPDPCAQNCGETHDYCQKTCANRAAESVPSVGSVDTGVLLDILGKGIDTKQCNDDCEHDYNQCMFQCTGPGGGGPEQGSGVPDQPPEAPDRPPE